MNIEEKENLIYNGKEKLKAVFLVTVLISAVFVGLIANISATVYLEEDMESGPGGWTWDGLWNQTMYRSRSGNVSWYYGNQSALNYTTYGPMGDTRNMGNLTSPSIDLTLATEATLSFWTWYETEGGMFYDNMSIHISEDFGPFIWEYQINPMSMMTWINISLNISSHVGHNIRIRFVFDTIDEWVNDFEGWYIDDVVVYDSPADLLVHTYGSLAPATVTQGDTDVEMLALRFGVQAASPGDFVNITSIRLDLTGTGSDTDITSVRLYDDVDADQVLTPPDNLLGTQTFSGGTLTFTDLWFTVVKGTSENLLIVFDINLIATVGAFVGCGILDETYITVAAPDEIAPFSNYNSTNSLIQAAPIDSMDVADADVAPLNVNQGQADVVMIRYRFTVAGSVNVTSIRVDLLGTGSDADISDVRLIHDVDTDGLFTPPDVQLGAGTFSGGTLTFSGLWLTVNTTTPWYFIILYNISVIATPGATVGCGMVDETYITVAPPDIVTPFSFFYSTNSTITAGPPDTLVIIHLDLAPGTVTQGDTDIAMMGLWLIANTGTVYVTSLMLDLTGTGTDTDVSDVRLYDDFDDTGTLTPADTLLGNQTFSGGTLTFSGLLFQVDSGIMEYLLIVFNISASATIGNTVGCVIVDETYITVGAPDTVNPFSNYNTTNSTIQAPITATLKPPYSDFGNDTNGDGYFDFLVVNVSVNVTTGGWYAVLCIMYNLTGFYITENSTFYWRNPGIYEYQINLSGYEIYQAGYDGPYNITIELYRWEGFWDFIDGDFYITNFYIYDQFRPRAIYEPPHDDYGVDTDSDTYYNFLVLNLTVNVSMAGWYNVGGDLYDLSWSTLIESQFNYTYLTAGIHVVKVNYSGISIYNSGINGPYNVTLGIFDDFWNLLDTDYYTTKFYLYDWFQHPPASLDPPHQDYGQDTNGNGLYNYLVVNVSVNVSTAGTYYIYSDLWDQFMMTWITWAENTTFLNSGIQEIQLYFPGWAINQSGINGPYNISLELYYNSTWIDAGYHVTGFYSPSAFDPPSSFEPPHSHYVLDTDFDTYFDFLIINVSVNVTYAGWYTVDAWLYNETGAIFIAFISNYTYLNPGIQEVQLYYNGVDIYSSGADGPYLVLFDLYDDWLGWLDSDSHLTSFYFYDQFQPPKAQLDPPHDDYGLDTDSDTYFNFLVVNVTVNVTTAGDYWIYGDMWDMFWITYITGTSNFTYLNTGIQVVQLYFYGRDIYDMGIDGPYSLQIELYDDNSTYLGTNFTTTSIYSYDWFQPPAALFDPPHDDYGLDTGSDGLFDFLVVNVTVNVTTAGNYTVEANLWDQNWMTVITSMSNYTTLVPGINIVQLYFSGLDIYNSGINGPYNISMDLYDDVWTWLDYDEYTTSFYQYDWFSLPNATFYPPYEDYGLDTDSDGYFNWLVVNITVNVSVIGNYDLWGGLYDEFWMFMITSAGNFTPLGVGIQQIQLYFDGSVIYNSGVNGPYNISMVLRDAWGTGLDTDTYLTSSYTYDQFEPPTALLWPPYSDYGIDTDGDGYFNWLVVNISVNVSEAGVYNLESELLDTPGIIWIISDSNSSFLSPGIQKMQLYFDGSQIFASGISGQYFIILDLYNASWTWLDWDSYLTKPYTYDQFEPPDAFFDPPHDDYGLDLYSDGEYDFLVVNVTVNVTTAGNYYIFGDLWDSSWSFMVTNLMNYTYLNVGVQVVQLYFDGYTINQSGINGPYNLSLNLLNETFVWQDNDEYQTNSYTYSQFRSNQAQLHPPYEDYGLDTDSDTYFNYLVVNVTVDVAVAGNYAIIGELWDFPPGTLINTTGNMSFLTPGLHVVQLYFEGVAINVSGINGPYFVSIVLLNGSMMLIDSDVHVTGAYTYDQFQGPMTTPWATAIGPVSPGTNNANPTITYSFGNSPTSVEIYVSDNGGASWILWGTDLTVDGSWPAASPLPASGTYYWSVRAIGPPDETLPSGPGDIEAGSYVLDIDAPYVVSTTPLNMAIGVAITQNIIITFNETMNNVTFTYTIEPNPGGLTPVWSVSDTILTISHLDFSTATRYWVNITVATDLAGNNLDILPYSFYFDTLITTANATGPIGGPTNVAGISILYSTINNPTYVDVYYTTDTMAPYTWTYIGADNPADGSFPWVVPADGSYGWFIRTSDWSAPIPSDTPEASYYIYDGTQPDVSSTVPLDMAIGVSVGQNVIITFDENMTTGSFVYTIEPNPGGLSPVWSVGTSVVTISHNAFATATRYWVNITAATDLAGNNLVTLPYSFYFDTVAGATTATATGPISGPTNIAGITILYSTTNGPTSVDLYYTTDTSAPYTWNPFGTDNPADGSFGWTVPADGSYGWYAKSPDEAAPLSSDAPEASFYIYDGTQPDVLTTNPLDMAIGVSVSQNVIITFDENMTTGSFVYTIEPNPGGLTPVWSVGTTVVTISHNPFTTATRYWVNITAATDLAGNSLVTLPYSFYFDTAATAATSTGPIGGPTNIAGIAILYSITGSPASVDIYYTTDISGPYTWTFMGTDMSVDGSFGWTVPADGSYGWFAVSPDESAPTPSDAPEASYYIYDGTQPDVSTTVPVDMAIGVSVSQNVIITFDENMTTGSFVYTIEPNPGGLLPVWSIGTTVVTISHNPFTTATRYWVNITAATDLAGNSLVTLPYSFYFDTAATAATATGPIGGPTNIAGVTILYSIIGSPATVDLYYTTNLSAPYTWTSCGTDMSVDGSFGWTIPADGSYGWFATSPDESAPTPSDAPEAMYYIYDATQPEVSSTIPIDMATGISVSQNIEIIFNETLNNITFTYTVEPNPGGLTPVWTVINSVLTISHTDFLTGTRYWVNITAATDLAGNDLSILPYSFYFDTVNSATVFGPVSGPTNIAGITITYLTTGSPASADIYYTTNITAPYTWTFIDTDSPADGSYGWTIPADGSYGWYAVSTDETAPTTSDAPEASYYVYDGTQPEVTGTIPLDLATGVLINQIIMIDFNDTMDTGTFTYTVEPNPGGLSVAWSGGNTTVNIYHTDFAVATRYWVNITAATDLAGNSLNPLPYSFYFDTAVTAAIATGPISGPTNIAGITISYTPTGSPASVDLYYTTDTTAPYTWTSAGTDLSVDGTFGWTIPADGSYGWLAVSPDEPAPTTSDAPEASYYIYDGTQPGVTTTTPTNAEPDVIINQDIVINFDESIVPVTFTYTIEPNPGGLSVIWSAQNMTITISHTNFTSASRYWVNITAAFDSAGNSLSTLPFSFYFDTIAFTGTATGPIGGPTNVANIDITYTITGSPLSVDLYYTTDNSTPYTWTLYGTDTPADGIFGITLPSDGSYGWIIVAQDETTPTSTDAPEASYYIYDGTAPDITSTSPVDLDDKVSINQSIIITFSEPIDTATLSFTCTPDPGGWTIEWNATNEEVTLNHTTFVDLQSYTINISWANDTAGNTLVPYEFTFTTEEDVTPPTVVSIVLSDPSPTTVGGVTFTITFSENLDTLFPPSVTFGETSPYNTYSISPTSFSGNTWTGSFMIDGSTGDGIHNISVSGARDLMGNAMVTDTSFTFEIDTTKPTSNVVGLTQYQTGWTFDVPFTASDPGGSGVLYVELYYRIDSTGNYVQYSGTFTSSPISFVATADGFYEFYTRATDNAGNVENEPSTADAFTTIDTTLPTVVSIVLSDPSPTTEGTVTFTITFSEDLNPSESPIVTFGLTTPFTTNTITQVSFSGTTWTGEFTITTSTGDGINYISVSGARDLASNLMITDTSFSFIIDTVIPTITDLTPAPSEEDVNVTTSIVITFSEDMDHATVESAFNFTDGTTVWTISDGSVSWVGNVMTFIPTEDLDYDTQYTVNVGTGAQDLAGLSLASVSWSFTTVESTDVTLPTITSVTPGISAVNVAVTTTVSITFSKSMNRTSVESAISISPGVTILSYSWDGNTLTLTLSSDLEYSTGYNITIGTGALDQGGNALAAPYGWEFTTTGRVAGEKEAEPTSWIPLLSILIIIIVIILLVLFMKMRGGGKKEELPEEEEEGYAEGMEEEEGPEAIDEEMPEEEPGVVDEEIAESEAEAPEELEEIEEDKDLEPKDFEEPEESGLDEEVAGEEETLDETEEPETEDLEGTEKEPIEETETEAGEEAEKGEAKESEKAAAKGKKKGKKRKARKKKRK